MKICRAMLDGECFYGVVDGDVIKKLDGETIDASVENAEEISISDVKLLAPVLPSKIVCVGKNYLAHADEMKEGVPDAPMLFIKPSTSVIGCEADIIYPSLSQRVDYEGELAIVMGKTAKDLTKDNWREYVLGFTCLNDVTARDIQKGDGQWTRGKGFDTFCPIGPWIETETDPDNANICTRLNGEIVQQANTSEMMFNAATVLEYVTAVMTLLPGDVVSMGTPKGVGAMQKGDCVEVEIEGIGVLKNYVR